MFAKQSRLFCREKREKTNITWPADGDQSTVTFYQRVTYYLDREMSVGNPDTDMVIGLSNPAVVSFFVLRISTSIPYWGDIHPGGVVPVPIASTTSRIVVV